MFWYVCAFVHQLHNAANANQKEKYESDLKKEIKKLQVRFSFDHIPNACLRYKWAGPVKCVASGVDPAVQKLILILCLHGYQ